MASISEDECILCGHWPEKDRWGLRDEIEIIPLEDDGACDVHFAMTILHHPHGSDEWIVSVDDDKEIKLRTSELTSYRRFGTQATIEAGACIH